MIKILLYIVFLFITLSLNAQKDSFEQQLDFIQGLRKLSENENLDLDKRIIYAKQAVLLSEETKIDSTILYSNIKLGRVYTCDEKDFDQSKKILQKNLILASELNDLDNSIYINNLLGYLYAFSRIKSDSAYYYYYNSIKVFEKIKKIKKTNLVLEIGKAQINIAHLQSHERDFTSSQATTVKAIKFLLKQPKSEGVLQLLSNAYEQLGLNLDYLKKYDKALYYYKKSLDIGNKLHNNYQDKLFTKINIAEVYKQTGDYKKTYEIYDELLKDKTIEEKGLNSYATILCNIAYTKFLSGDKNHSEIDSLFTKAHRIFEDLKLYYEIADSGNEMSDFYVATNQNGKALFYTEKAYEISKRTREYESELHALKQLSKLKKGDAGKPYLYKYIALNDSLIANERTNRNKFARIQFETDQYIEETKRLNTQNILISSIASVLIITLCLLYFIRRQQDKNKTLLFEKEQQETNQDIYSLMLKQQTKLEGVRMQERYRIGEGLHDGILSHLFGTRMGMGFLDLKGDKKTIETYKVYLDKIQSIEKEVRDVSHQLKSDTVLPKTNFESLISQYISQQSLIGCFSYSITSKAVQFDAIDDSIKVNLYRIIQESIQNIIKHAKAKRVMMQFYIETNRLNLVIEDDGIGFDGKTSKKGIGLKNMASRVLNLNGIFKIDSVTNKKTLIHIIIPI
ncbi:MAG: ATP-binding protein [Algibacter sp.]